MNTTGEKLWRSLEELSGTAEFAELLHREFPAAASEFTDEVSRRRFLKLMGASMALAGVAGCTYKPEEKIVPYVNQPEQVVPGRPLYFATVQTKSGYARGVLVESHEGRPTKIEGNPQHPATLGSSDVFMQASLLDLYDPDRSQTVTRAGREATWSDFMAALEPALTASRQNGAGLRILTQRITSPTLAGQLREVLKAFPGAAWHQWDPINRDNAAAGAKIAFGIDVQPIYRFDQAKVIVSLDDNFLFDHPGSVRYARDFINGRRVRHDNHAMNRLYVAESTPSITGAMADHRNSAPPSAIETIARELHAGSGGDDWVNAAAKDLAANRGAGLVVAGEYQPPVVHALAHAMNQTFGNVGKTVVHVDPIEAEPTHHVESLRSLVADMKSGAMRTLIILDGNPAYDAPADLDFDEALKAFSDKKENFSAHLSCTNDETSFRTQWHLPLAHELESWGDAREFEGTASIIQPLIAPLYQGRTDIEVVSLMLGQQGRSGYEIVRDFWRGQHKNDADFESWWEKCLHDGIIPQTASQPKAVKPPTAVVSAPATQPASGIEIVFRPDPSLWDGRYANNGWLMELPKPLTRLTWDNVALMSHATAVKLGVIDVTHAPGNKVDSTIVELAVDGRKVRAPAWIMPGQPDDVITVHLGHGRSHAGRIGTNVGFNAYTLRTSASPWFAGGLRVARTGDTTFLACVQHHAMMDQHERDLLRVVPIGNLDSSAKTQAAHGAGHKSVSLSLYPEYDYSKTPNKWGMVIDQNACIGCQACVVACQAENNIPVVGKEEVAKGREMHWLRVDNYFGGDADDPDGPYFQPVPCMHCENAPCEVVCPVAATVHDAEGNNNMVYNRCVGTRYCQNNCPYKVRRFNFFHYTKNIEGPLKLMMNPDVTVRYRGVMEKCTYCIQRINAGRIDAKIDDRAINDGEVVTACQQACPTMAIVFGNLNDKNAAVTKLAAEPTNYGLLDELQTKPRTTYLPRFTNPS